MFPSLRLLYEPSRAFCGSLVARHEPKDEEEETASNEYVQVIGSG